MLSCDFSNRVFDYQTSMVDTLTLIYGDFLYEYLHWSVEQLIERPFTLRSTDLLGHVGERPSVIYLLVNEDSIVNGLFKVI